MSDVLARLRAAAEEEACVSTECVLETEMVVLRTEVLALVEVAEAAQRCQSWAIDYSEGRLDATLALPAVMREINEALARLDELG